MATTPIIFSLIDSKNSCFYSRIYISPISYPLVYSGSIVVGDAVATITNDRSPIVTVNLIPNQYECRCIGQDNTYETQFYISVPSSSTPVSASSILYNIQNFTANATASYAISSSYATTASYALNGGGGGSSVWQANGNDIINTNTGRVYITGSDMQINSSIYVPNLTPQTVLITDEYNVVSSGNATTTDLNNIVGTIDNVQTQLNAKYQSGSLLQPSYIQTPWIDYLVDGSPLWNEGRVFYDSTQHTLCVYNDKSNVTLNVGEENWVRIVNKTGAIITNGSAVTISGSQGNRPQGILAQSTMTSGSTSYGIIGISTEDIAINAEGMITILGAVRSIDTHNFSAGDTLYVSSSAGKLTNVKPSIPYEVIKIGIALNSTANGSILVSPYDVIHPSDISGYGDLTVTNNQANININTIPSNSYGRLVFKDSGSERVAIQFLNNQFDAYYTTSGRSNALEIYNNTGSTIFFNSGSERARITKDGSFIVNKAGVTSSAYKLEVSGSIGISGSNGIYFQNANGFISFPAYGSQINDGYGLTLQTNNNIRPVRVAGSSGLYVGAANGYTTPAGSIIAESNISSSGYVTGSKVYGDQLLALTTASGGGAIQCNGPLYLGSSNNSGIRNYSGDTNLQLYGYYNVNVCGQAGAQYAQATVWDVNGNVAIGVPARSATGAMTTGRFYVSASNGTDPLITANNGSNNVFTVGAASPIVKISGSAAADTLLDIKTSAGSSSLFVTGSNVGIGTANPMSMLDINGGGFSDSRVKLGVNGFIGATNYWLMSGGGLTSFGGDIIINPNQVTAMTFKVGGNVGIGTTTPSAKLDISGSAAAEKLLNIKNSSNAQIMFVSSSGAVGIGNNTNIHSTVAFQVNTGTDKNVAVQSSTTLANGVKINAITDNAAGGIPFEINGYPVVIKYSESEKGRFDTNGLTVQGNISASAGNIYGGVVSASAYSASNAGFYCPGNTANSGLKVGTMNVQSFATNNGWISENCTYNGSNFVATNTGYVGLFYFQNPEGQFRFSSTSITAGGTWTPTVISKMYGTTNTVALGGSMPTAAGNFTNAVLYVSGSGLVGVNSITPSYTLDVNGTTRTTGLILPTTPPGTPATGSCYYSNSFFYVYTGAAWKSASLS